MKKLNSILLVDDDATTNFYNEYLIKSMKICDNVHVSANGKEALEYIRDSKTFSSSEIVGDENFCNLILLDINMPIMDGFEFLEKYNEQANHTSHNVIICMLTTSLHSKDRNRAEQHPLVSGFISKPLLEKYLSGIINNNFS